MRGWVAFAAVNGFIGVLAGALGAHVLSGQVGAKGLEWLGTAERYQMWHALALLVVALLARPGDTRAARRWLQTAATAFGVGIVLFSGSLYVLTLTGWRPVAMVTPLGGLAFLVGWVALAGHAVCGRAR